MNNNETKKIKKDLESATKSVLETLKNVSDDTKEKYNASEKDLEEKQKKESHKEALETQEIEDRKSNRELRENYANKMFRYMYIWSSFIVLAIIFTGLDFDDKLLWGISFKLDKEILITLIASATVSIFAIIRAIIKGIFKER